MRLGRDAGFPFSTLGLLGERRHRQSRRLTEATEAVVGRWWASVTKGVFITTSSFAESAKEFVLRGSNTKIVLIDGEALLDLMMRHHIGVRVERRVEVLDLDQHYVEDAQ
jgi:restriction endonuclease Mrr